MLQEWLDCIRNKVLTAHFVTRAESAAMKNESVAFVAGIHSDKKLETIIAIFIVPDCSV